MGPMIASLHVVAKIKASVIEKHSAPLVRSDCLRARSLRLWLSRERSFVPARGAARELHM